MPFPILVCCDLQDDCSPADSDSVLATTAAAALLARWRALHWPVAHLKRLGQRQWLARGAAAPEWSGPFRPKADELAFVHPLPSAYSSAHFAQYMQTLPDTACVLVGCSLDETILATAMEGYHRNHRYYLAPDAVACRAPRRADADTYRRTVITIVQKFSGTFRAAGTSLSQSNDRPGGLDRLGPPRESRSA